MTQPQETIETSRETVGVFPDADSLQGALDDLQESGFIWRNMSVLADDKTIERELGHIYNRVEEAEDDPAAPYTAFVPKEVIGQIEGAAIGVPLYVAGVTATGIVVASGGTLLSTITAATFAAAAGAGIGTILARFIAKRHADYIQKQLDRGGLLLWVSVHSPEEENKAAKILGEHSAYDIHVHEIPVCR